MLIDHPIATTRDQVSDVIALDNGNDCEPIKIMDGVYQRGDFSIVAARETALIDEHPSFAVGHCFGVCDDYMQVFDAIPELVSSHRQFFVTVTPIHNSQDETIDFDWQQWGPYVGDRLLAGYADLNDIDNHALLIYHVYEVIPRNSLH